MNNNIMKNMRKKLSKTPMSLKRLTPMSHNSNKKKKKKKSANQEMKI